jgi:hypothetical protein
MTETNLENYLIRDSLFNLVELSLLARFYEEFCVPASPTGALSKASLSQTLLKMKATENAGRLKVAIYHTDPVGFYWQYQGQVLAHWVHPDHRNHGVEQGLLDS